MTHLLKRFRWLTLVVGLTLLISLATSIGGGLIMAQSATSPARAGTTKFWMQVMDSCKQAIPGSSFVLVGNGLNVPMGPSPGTRPQTVSHNASGCPLQRGTCLAFPTGCLSWDIPIPATGSLTYKINETRANPLYVPCTGGSVCTGGPVVITLTIDSTGKTSATAYNVYPDGYAVTWPTTGAPYTGAQNDPVVVHNFGLGNISCDGDNDADDHLTGSPSAHCDNDKDRGTSSGSGGTGTSKGQPGGSKGSNTGSGSSKGQTGGSGSHQGANSGSKGSGSGSGSSKGQTGGSSSHKGSNSGSKAINLQHVHFQKANWWLWHA